MKRRTFLQSLAAAAAATPLLSHSATQSPSAELPSDEVARVEPRPRTLRAIIAMDTHREAQDVWAAMGRRGDVMLMGAGAAPCGVRTEMIFDAIESRLERDMAWVNQNLRTRLVPGGEEVAVHFNTGEFDWGTQSAVAASFLHIGNASFHRQACRFHVPLEKVTYEQKCKAKAQLFEWYIDNPPPEDRNYS